MLLGEDVVGPAKYSKTGVEIDGKVIAWKNLSSLKETDPEPVALKEPDSEAQKQVELKRLTLKALEFADWCRAHALYDEEWKTIVELLVADNWNREAIKRVKPIMQRRIAKTVLRPPFEGRWKAMVDANQHHQIKVFAIEAIDWVKVDGNGRLHKGTGKSVDEYFGWNDPVYAAADGEVCAVEDRFDDMPIGKAGKFDQANYVEIKHAESEYTLYAHTKKGSAAVKKGDRVKAGQLVARVGNSGASGLPHVHFTMQTPVWSAKGGAWIGMPARFENFKLVEALGTACAVEVKLARPQEGWILVASAP